MTSTSDFKQTYRDYISLTKPGIIRGNLLAALAGFFLGSPHHISVERLIAMVLGTSLIIGSACVYNNCLDRNIDKKMERTKNRPLAAGRIRVANALIFASLLLLGGSIVLARYTYSTTLAIALFGVVAYVAIYGFGKRRTAQGTLIGSISGAVPPVIGYTAATGQLDRAALILFLILTFWQMPHFYGIAMYRLKDYKNAKIPVLPAVRGMSRTKLHVVGYIIAYTVTATSLSWFGITHWVYFVGSLLLGLLWLYKALSTIRMADDSKWGKGVFLVSLLVLSLQCLLIAVGPRLP